MDPRFLFLVDLFLLVYGIKFPKNMVFLTKKVGLLVLLKLSFNMEYLLLEASFDSKNIFESGFVPSSELTFKQGELCSKLIYFSAINSIFLPSFFNEAVNTFLL